MAALASLFFAFALNTSQLEPMVTWVFSGDMCESCTNAQAEILKRFIKPGDKVVLNYPARNRKAMKQLKALIKKASTKVEITEQQSRYRGIVTGWILLDPTSDEEIIYQVKNLQYGSMRSQVLLELFRDRNDP